MKKTAFVILSFVLFITSLLFSGCGDTENKKESDRYEKDILSRINQEELPEGKLSGMAEDIIVISGEEDFDPDEFSCSFAGLFSEDTGETLYLKNPLKKLYPASITKCMTALLVLQNEKDLNKEVTVTEEAFAGLTETASDAGLSAGEKLTVSDLLYAMLVPSGNEAANALAVFEAGSTEAFVVKMNEKAQELGMVNTHFVNPNGLPDDSHYTTVYDLYLLFRACMKENGFSDYAGAEKVTVEGTLSDGSKVSHVYRSTNSYMLRYTIPPSGISVAAGKTGYTVKAGRCLILSVRDSEGRLYYGIICGAKSYDSLYEEMNKLLSKI